MPTAQTTPPAADATAGMPLDDAARQRAAAEAFDASLHAAAARWTSGLSPISLALAATDWALHLATQPAQSARLALQAQLGTWSAWRSAWQSAFGRLAGAEAPGPRADREDHRFEAPAWQAWPMAPVVDTYLAAEDWWREATTLRGMTPHHQEMARVFARQWLDLLSPANAGLANPEVLQRTLQRRGSNLLTGAANALEDWLRGGAGHPPQPQSGAALESARQLFGLSPLPADARPYAPGVDVAVTPGRVVHRNALVELIQYAPSTPQVDAEPVFIVPSWIMKYYILDLSSTPPDTVPPGQVRDTGNSMVAWLVAQGHTVFIVSWRNPDEADALLDMADYLQLGVLDPLAAIARLLPGEAVHACGYCLGGTLLAIAAAALARPQRVAGAEQLPALASLSLLAAETDFSEPGEMGVLIDESQVALLEDMMAERGFLTGRQMAGSFQFLHSRELVWSATLHELWMGERLRPNDLMAWNADTTRMPAAMHSEYLRRCYLHNELAQSRYPVEGSPVSLADIRAPLFVVGTEKDHVSPWRSVYKLHGLTDTELCFVLTNGGHNAGIVSEPGRPHRYFQALERPAGGNYIPPDDWLTLAPRHEGSWWPEWSTWLAAHSGSPVAPPPMGADDYPPLADAPGSYVLEK